MTTSEMVEVLLTHSYGRISPCEIRCGSDRHKFICEILDAEAAMYKGINGYRMPGGYWFLDARVVCDQNMLTEEFCVWPALASKRTRWPEHPDLRLLDIDLPGGM